MNTIKFYLLLVFFLPVINVAAQLLDTFEGPGLDLLLWSPSSNPGGSIALDNQQLTITCQNIGRVYFYGLRYIERTFTIPSDGGTLVFSVDLVKGDRENSAGWLSFSVTDGTFYLFAKDEAGMFLAKNNGSLNFFFDTRLESSGSVKNENVKLVMSMTGIGSSVFINTQVLDLENGNAVLFDRTVEDTSGADPMVTGSDHRPESLVGQTGRFAIRLFHFQFGTAPSEIIFDNPRVGPIPRVDVPPELSIDYSQTNVTLWWVPLTNMTFTLEETLTLSPPHWTPAPSGTNNPVTLLMPESDRYYRLRSFVQLMITGQPRSQEVEPGMTATFSVTAEGDGDLSYQWYFNGAELVGEIAAILTVTDADVGDDGDYVVVVTDQLGSVISEPARLTLLVPPTIVEHPQSQTIPAGDTVTFSVTVTNTATLPIGYRWRKNSVELTNMVLESHVSTYTINNVQPADAASYRVVVTNAAFFLPGFQSDPAILTVSEE